MGALAPAIFRQSITVSQGQDPQWKNSINTQHPQYQNSKYDPEVCTFKIIVIKKSSAPRGSNIVRRKKYLEIFY